jgi:hypothetical protein
MSGEVQSGLSSSIGMTHFKQQTQALFAYFAESSKLFLNKWFMNYFRNILL